MLVTENCHDDFVVGAISDAQTGSDRGHTGARDAHSEGMPDNRKDQSQGQKQTDLAEGEPSTVEESIRIHEKKGDQQGRPAKTEKDR
jgi:hypothetical protein